MNTGQEFVKAIRPAGCILFLLISIYFLVFCFTAHGTTIPDYESPHNTSYYSQSDDTLLELKTELETNVFPHMAGIKDCKVENRKLQITIDNDSFANGRATILKYYDKSLFDFVKADTGKTQQ